MGIGRCKVGSYKDGDAVGVDSSYTEDMVYNT